MDALLLCVLSAGPAVAVLLDFHPRSLWKCQLPLTNVDSRPPTVTCYFCLQKLALHSSSRPHSSYELMPSPLCRIAVSLVVLLASYVFLGGGEFRYYDGPFSGRRSVNFRRQMNPVVDFHRTSLSTENGATKLAEYLNKSTYN